MHFRLLLVLSLAALPTLRADECDLARLVECLRQVEDFAGRDGHAGERGVWQLSAAVWADRMPGVPFAQARLPDPARLCAGLQVAWLARKLASRGRSADARSIAMAWNAGLSRALSGRVSPRTRDYAARVENLYRDRTW